MRGTCLVVWIAVQASIFLNADHNNRTIKGYRLNGYGYFERIVESAVFDLDQAQAGTEAGSSQAEAGTEAASSAGETSASTAKQLSVFVMDNDKMNPMYLENDTGTAWVNKEWTYEEEGWKIEVKLQSLGNKCKDLSCQYESLYDRAELVECLNTVSPGCSLYWERRFRLVEEVEACCTPRKMNPLTVMYNFTYIFGTPRAMLDLGNHRNVSFSVTFPYVEPVVKNRRLLPSLADLSRELPPPTGSTSGDPSGPPTPLRGLAAVGSTVHYYIPDHGGFGLSKVNGACPDEDETDYAPLGPIVACFQSKATEPWVCKGKQLLAEGYYNTTNAHQLIFYLSVPQVERCADWQSKMLITDAELVAAEYIYSDHAGSRFINTGAYASTDDRQLDTAY